MRSKATRNPRYQLTAYPRPRAATAGPSILASRPSQKAIYGPRPVPHHSPPKRQENASLPATGAGLGTAPANRSTVLLHVCIQQVGGLSDSAPCVTSICDFSCRCPAWSLLHSAYGALFLEGFCIADVARYESGARSRDWPSWCGQSFTYCASILGCCKHRALEFAWGGAGGW